MAQDTRVLITRFKGLFLRHRYEDDEKGDYAQLEWLVRGNYPRIMVYLENKNRFEPGARLDYNKIIIAAFTPVRMIALLTTLKAAVNFENDTNVKIDTFNIKYESGLRTKELEKQSTVIVGKDKEGIVYIAVTAEGKKKVRFSITSKDEPWEKRYDLNGDLITDPAILSRTHAAEYFKLLEGMMMHTLITLGAMTNDAPVKNGTTDANKLRPMETNLGSDKLKIDEAELTGLV